VFDTAVGKRNEGDAGIDSGGPALKRKKATASGELEGGDLVDDEGAIERVADNPQ